MGRACLRAVVVVAAGLAVAAGAGPADAKRVRPLIPTGGMWQSIPYTSEAADRADSATSSTSSATPRAAGEAVAAKVAKSAPAAGAKGAALPKARAPRHPVAAAAPAEEAPRTSAAARAKELDRRIGVLMPGAKLGEPMPDRENPAWRRPRPGRSGAETNSLSLPLDETGKSGFVARGYHTQPDAQNPQGSTGATFGLRTKF